MGSVTSSELPQTDFGIRFILQRMPTFAALKQGSGNEGHSCRRDGYHQWNPNAPGHLQLLPHQPSRHESVGQWGGACLALACQAGGATANVGFLLGIGSETSLHSEVVLWHSAIE